MNSLATSPLIARLLLAFSVIAFLASVRAIGNADFRNRLLRDPRFLKQGTKITLASAWLSALWWAVLSAFLTLIVFHIESSRLDSFLEPMAGGLLLAWILTTYYEYRRRKRSG
jgi:hypothetical protein